MHFSPHFAFNTHKITLVTAISEEKPLILPAGEELVVGELRLIETMTNIRVGKCDPSQEIRSE